MFAQSEPAEKRTSSNLVFRIAACDQSIEGVQAYEIEREQDPAQLRRIALAMHAQVEQFVAALARKCKELESFKGSRDEAPASARPDRYAEAAGAGRRGEGRAGERPTGEDWRTSRPRGRGRERIA